MPIFQPPNNLLKLISAPHWLIFLLRCWKIKYIMKCLFEGKLILILPSEALGRLPNSLRILLQCLAWQVGTAATFNFFFFLSFSFCLRSFFCLFRKSVSLDLWKQEGLELVKVCHSIKSMRSSLIEVKARLRKMGLCFFLSFYYQHYSKRWDAKSLHTSERNPHRLYNRQPR